ncbi:DoxX family protein [Pseudoxanthomonas sp. PXM02]|uniref:DoxX family protein n=1 Tax=Pseudoxanthomonas sp. PXM02 TaxID=2769294 RepID=UPI0017852CCA|nr:DoxX family protein [Pseudoxanthomonas sp. PXM02]MBD9478766.1 DoxX family protein [Pseudoxanthomonas sp. PXM02]
MMSSMEPSARQSLAFIRMALATLLFIHGVARVLAEGVTPFGAFLEAQDFPFGLGIAWFVTVFELVAAPVFAAGRWVTPIALVFAAIYTCGIWLVHAQAGWFVVGLGRNGVEYSVLILACLLANAWAHRPRASLPT